MPKQRTYTGASGQMLTVAELLLRQCNAAVPMVDFGTDVFAFHDDREEVARIQVKTTHGERYKNGNGYWAKFDIPMKQLLRPDSPPLYYALVTRIDSTWEDVLVISRTKLSELWNGNQKFGSENAASGNLVIRVKFIADSVTCSDVDLSEYKNAWDSLPPLKVPVDLGS